MLLFLEKLTIITTACVYTQIVFIANNLIQNLINAADTFIGEKRSELNISRSLIDNERARSEHIKVARYEYQPHGHINKYVHTHRGYDVERNTRVQYYYYYSV